jgi:hypothetical protein
MNGNEARAEEIIADIWRQIRDLHERGLKPDSVVLSPSIYRLIQAYRAGLGDLEEPGKDYLTRYAIFGLPVFIDSGLPWAVRASPGDQGK